MTFVSLATAGLLAISAHTTPLQKVFPTNDGREVVTVEEDVVDLDEDLEESELAPEAFASLEKESSVLKRLLDDTPKKKEITPDNDKLQAAYDAAVVSEAEEAKGQKKGESDEDFEKRNEKRVEKAIKAAVPAVQDIAKQSGNYGAKFYAAVITSEYVALMFFDVVEGQKDPAVRAIVKVTYKLKDKKVVGSEVEVKIPEKE